MVKTIILHHLLLLLSFFIYLQNSLFQIKMKLDEVRIGFQEYMKHITLKISQYFSHADNTKER